LQSYLRESRCCWTGCRGPHERDEIERLRAQIDIALDLLDRSGQIGDNDSRATMCNLYSITTNQAAIMALFRAINRYVGNLPPMPGVFPDYPAPVVRNAGAGRELTMMRWPARPR
jgi:hypothetical protein